MIAVGVVAVVLGQGVLGPGPDLTSPARWAFALAATNLPAVIIVPFLFRLRGTRFLLVMISSAAITLAQFMLRVPPNLYAVDGYLALAAMARLARDDRDFQSALAAVASGILVGVAIGFEPCTPIVAFLAPSVGIVVRLILRPRPKTRSLETALDRAEVPLYAKQWADSPAVTEVQPRDRA
jgi:hypothetical protein